MFVVGGANTLNSKSIVFVSNGLRSIKSKVKVFAVCEVTSSLAFKKFSFASSNSKDTEPLSWVPYYYKQCDKLYQTLVSEYLSMDKH